MSETYTIKNERGSIVITRNAVARIVSKVVDEFKGRVFITNQRGKFFGIVSRIGGFDETGNIEINFTKDGVDIRVFIAIRFGTSIGMVTTRLMDSINDGVRRIMGIEPKSVAVVMTGTVSRTIAKKNMDLKRKYDIKH